MFVTVNPQATSILSFDKDFLFTVSITSYQILLFSIRLTLVHGVTVNIFVA